MSSAGEKAGALALAPSRERGNEEHRNPHRVSQKS